MEQRRKSREPDVDANAPATSTAGSAAGGWATPLSESGVQILDLFYKPQ